MYFRSFPKIYKTSKNNNNKVTIRLTNNHNNNTNNSSTNSLLLKRSMSGGGDVEDPEESGKKARSSPITRSLYRLTVRFRMLPKSVQFVLGAIVTLTLGVVVGYVAVAIAATSIKNFCLAGCTITIR